MNTIYLVDDDPSVRRALGRLLTVSGYSVVTCDSAEQFLGLARLSRPSCLVLDLRMPGLNGLDLLDALRAGHDPPVVIVSGHADRATAARAIAAGAIAVLAKPVDHEALLSAVELGLDRDRRALGASLPEPILRKT